MKVLEISAREALRTQFPGYERRLLPFGIKVLARFDKKPLPQENLYLKAIEDGKLRLTPLPAEALRFRSSHEAYRSWIRTSSWRLYAIAIEPIPLSRG